MRSQSFVTLLQSFLICIWGGCEPDHQFYILQNFSLSWHLSHDNERFMIHWNVKATFSMLNSLCSFWMLLYADQRTMLQPYEVLWFHIWTWISVTFYCIYTLDWNCILCEMKIWLNWCWELIQMLVFQESQQDGWKSMFYSIGVIFTIFIPVYPCHLFIKEVEKLSAIDTSNYIETCMNFSLSLWIECLIDITASFS